MSSQRKEPLPTIHTKHVLGTRTRQERTKMAPVLSVFQRGVVSVWWGAAGPSAPPSGPLASSASEAQVLPRALCSSWAPQCSGNSLRMLEQALGWSKSTQKKIWFANYTAFLNVPDCSRHWCGDYTSAKAASVMWLVITFEMRSEMKCSLLQSSQI